MSEMSWGYRTLINWHRAMVVFWWHDETRVEHHAKMIQQYVEWGTLDQRSDKPLSRIRSLS